MARPNPKTAFASAASLLAVVLLVTACGRTPPLEGPGGLRASTIWVDRTADVGQFDSLAADSKGIPHISYYDYTNGDLKYARLDPDKGTWVVQAIDQPGDVGLYTSIAIDSQDNPHIVYYDATNDYLKYAYFNGLEWKTQPIFTDHGGLFASIAIDANDVSHITFITRGHYNLHYIKFNRLDPSAYAEDTILDTGVITGPSGVGGNINGATSVRILPDSQTPIIAYYHASFGALQVIRYDPNSKAARTENPGKGWVPTVVDGGDVVGAGKDDVGEYASLHVVNDNDYHVSYYNRTQQDLRYAHWDGDHWTRETIDKEGMVGESSSITVVCKKDKSTGANDCRPYISYFDSTNNDLKVATRRLDSNWVTFRADMSGMTGTYTSIAQVSRGRVGISYRDQTYLGLKFLLFMPF